MKLFLVFFFLIGNLVAQNDYSLRVAYGKASTKDLGEILLGNFEKHPDNLGVLALDGGYLLKESIFELPIDFYLKGGLSYFDENNKQNDVYEGVVYIKFYYNIDFLDNRIRIGLGEGFSYVSDVLYCEEKEAREKKDNNSKFLNYLDISFDFDLGRLVGYEPLKDTYIGWTIKHRSGVFGLINDVKHGGSNYNTISIEKNF
ncbi:MAG: hypothetical protein U9N33_12125 [Campylobacterota bacterium]|nr:hypothetical protein [Campylobacterota bacterium]